MSALREYQRSVLRLAFAQQVREPDLQVFGDPSRAELYRHMIRTRLYGMSKVAFKRSLEVLGEAAFEQSFARYLERCPPKSPYIREVIEAFGPFARADAQLLEAAPPFASDLLRFEESKWRVAYRPAPRLSVGEGGVREFDFEGAMVLNPTLEVLSLQHAVHELGEGGCRRAALTLLVYRRGDEREVRWYAPDAFFAGVLARAQQGQRPLAALVRETAAAQNLPLDEALLERLATSVTFALEREVLIGSRQPRA
jgi:hypothetical protein